MYLLYTDEANIDPRDSEFFIYAGIAIPGDTARDLSNDISAIRAGAGYQSQDVLKFNTVERPAQISADVHREVKRQVIAAAANRGVKLLASFILHSIATSPDQARRNEINRICYHFDCLLGRERDHGLVLLDPFNDSLGQVLDHLREKFSVGLVGMPYSNPMALRRILGYHLASVGTSHFCSLADISIGSLRYAVNNRAASGRAREVARTLVAQLASLCVRDSAGRAHEISIFFSPKIIQVPAYLATYRDLHEFLAGSGIEAAQEPTDQRTY